MSKASSQYKGKPKGPRWPLLTAIALFHVFAIYGLGRLFAPELTASVERDVVSVFDVIVAAPDDPPPQTPPEPDEGAEGAAGEEAVPAPVTAPSSPIERESEPLPTVTSTGSETVSGAREEGEGSGARGAGDGTGSGNQGSGQGNGTTTRPSVRSGSLDPRRDFPVPEGGRSTRFGTSVTVAFTVTRDGLARDCSVVRSSSDPETTALVCGLVIEKIRFNPALSRAGDPVEARYGYRVDFRAR
ncbi:MAG: energy transducer TonB [Pseudomonadota bacterium]